ncbi:putative isomerase YbhE [Rickenella mellea]|uniref:Putative isomerase YbhE n=1 Tax=Rickenella mellea TaxID=50990 RepID=A0A4Y7PZ87_9AGAM|nr:putative isomerase YbhE [Rickenella mellea]
MVNLTILAGGYTTFVATYTFNTDTNALTLAGKSTTGANPSWIALNPTNRSILYAVNENTQGGLQSFAISSHATLSPLSTIQSGGGDPAFATPISTGAVAVMNYNSGNGKIVPTTSGGAILGSGNLITFPAKVSHPHMALQHNNEVFVPDLGADKIWRLVQSGNNWNIQGLIQQPTGSGPRHIAIQGNYLFTLHELSSTITSQAIPAAPNGTSPFISNLSILPPNPPAGSVFAAAEILYPTTDYLYPGKYIYVSNRNTGVQDPRGDAIAIFLATSTGSLNLVGHVYTGLNQIRGMQLFGPNLSYLIAGGYGGGGVAVFERENNGANLTLLARNAVLPTATSFVWVY